MKTKALAFLLACLGNVAAAQAPATVPISGTLRDSDGDPISADVDLTLSLYGAASGGTALYSETASVTAQEGRFTHDLGSGTATDDFELTVFAGGGPFYLGIAVGEDEEATPRIRLGSVPFAAYADEAGNAETLGGQPLSALQPAVSGSCDSNQAIQGFDASGAVQCAVISTPSGGTLTGVGTSAASGLSGGCTSGTCQLAVDYAATQRRVVGSCDGGEFMVAVGTSAPTCLPGYSNANAIAAMGAISNTNPHHHNRYTDAEARAVCFDQESELTALLNNNYVATVTAGTGLSGGGTSGSISLSHADTSTQSSVTNSGTTIIQSVSVDGQGHVTGLASTTLTTLDSLGTCAAGDVPVWSGSAWACGEQRPRVFTTPPSLTNYVTIDAPVPFQGSGAVTFWVENTANSADPACNSSRQGLTRIHDTGPEQLYCFCNQVNLSGAFRWWCVEIEP